MDNGCGMNEETFVNLFLTSATVWKILLYTSKLINLYIYIYRLKLFIHLNCQFYFKKNETIVNDPSNLSRFG
jgi:hypothetical protein